MHRRAFLRSGTALALTSLVPLASAATAPKQAVIDAYRAADAFTR